MADITLVRQEPTEISEADRMVLHRVLFGIIDGLGETNRKKWRGLWKRILKLGAGEMLDIRTHQARLGWYHRKHLNFEHKLFEAQERIENFEQFRMWLKVGAGHVDWLAGPRGGVIPVPKSISYAQMEQSEFEVYHANVLDFVRQPHATKFLWKHLNDQQQLEMIESVIEACGAYQM